MSNTYQLEPDGVTMSMVSESNDVTIAPNNALAKTVEHAYSITSTTMETMGGYKDDPYEVHVTVNIPRRQKTFTFVGKGKSFKEAHAMIEVDVRREINFWRFCIGSNQSQDKFPNPPVPYEKQRNPQLYHSGESSIIQSMNPVIGQTHPHKHSG